MALFFETSAFAQEEKPTDNKSEQTAQKETPTQEEENKDQSSSDEIFTPTEEISEDLSVSFPVDI